jgi:hypothetical protein
MTNDDRLFGYRLQLFDYAARTSVAEACRVFGSIAPPAFGAQRVCRAACRLDGLEDARPCVAPAPTFLPGRRNGGGALFAAGFA